jgi:hypothetical protein
MHCTALHCIALHCTAPQGGETTEERSRRHAAVGLGPHQGSSDVFSEDGVPVLRKKYKSYKRDNQGRVVGSKRWTAKARQLSVQSGSCRV